jgi:hypothetical protein
MAHASSAHSSPSTAGAQPEVPELLFKPDRPRAIDRHIDYFGGTADGSADADDDRCADAALERPA